MHKTISKQRGQSYKDLNTMGNTEIRYEILHISILKSPTYKTDSGKMKFYILE